MRTYWSGFILATIVCLFVCVHISGHAAAEAFQGANGKIAYASNNQIYTMEPDGSSKTDLSNDVFDDSEPAWSPDGSKIVYVSDASGSQQIYIMNADGSDPTRLTTDTANDTEPSWAPTGTQIVYVSDASGSQQIYIMNADGSDPTRLTTDTANDTEPSWSPGGHQIAYQSDVSGSPQIYTINDNGTDPTQVTTDSASDIDPRWATDASTIIFSSNRTGNYQIYTMNPDGTNLQAITDDSNNYILPSYSPDLSQITFTRTDGTPEIYVMDVSGQNMVELTTTAANSQSDWQSLKLPIAVTTPSTTIAVAANLPMAESSIAVNTVLYAVNFNPNLLPAGISYGLTKNSIYFTGTPTGPVGTVSVPIVFYNGYSNIGATILFNIYPPVAIVTPSLPGATVGSGYQQQIGIENGDNAPTFSISSGALPPGLAIGSATGVISGTPTTAGMYTFSVEVSDANAVTKQFAIDVINPTVAVASETSPSPSAPVIIAAPAVISRKPTAPPSVAVPAVAVKTNALLTPAPTPTTPLSSKLQVVSLYPSQIAALSTANHHPAVMMTSKTAKMKHYIWAIYVAITVAILVLLYVQHKLFRRTVSRR